MNWFSRFLITIISFTLIIVTAIGLAIFALNTYRYYKNTYLFARVLLYIIGGYLALIFTSFYLCGFLMSMDSSGEVESDDVEQDIEIETIEERRSTLGAGK